MNPYQRNNSRKLLIRINPYLYPLDVIKLFLSNYYCFKFYLDYILLDYIYTYMYIYTRLELITNRIHFKQHC